jgi:hypothetical protein
MNHNILKAGTDELKARDVAYEHGHGGRHDFVWFAINGRTHTVPISLSSSDWRAPLNARARVRRMIEGRE